MQIEETVVALCRAARQAARQLATAGATAKNAALTTAAARMRSATPDLLDANRHDVAAAITAGASGILSLGICAISQPRN